MIQKYSIKELLKKGIFFLNQKVLVEGWIRSMRYSIFLSLNDGSTINHLQIVLSKYFKKEFLKKITIGTSIRVIGIIKKSIGKKQCIELHSTDIKIYQSVPTQIMQKSILQPKKHSIEKIREQSHLRFQTNIFGCIMRIRNNMSFSIHKYFYEKNFFYINTPIITTSDCEGAGKMFQVTSMDLNQNDIDYTKDFFKCKTYLSVSGQLEAEVAALGLGKVYTFGPVFRAENSNTSRHLSEFWMVEPEMAFFHLEENIHLAEDLIKFTIQYILDHCMDDLSFLNENIKKWNMEGEISLLEKLKYILKYPFKKISYTEVINILNQEKEKKNITFTHTIFWGMDLQSEHEQYLVNIYFKKRPLIIYNYPFCIKSFYMRVNDDGKTVKSMDILLPGIGEIIGGSQREERYEVLLTNIKNKSLDKKLLWWYLDTRRFGSVPHSGFGLGFDRFVQFMTGMKNIRDVIPFPRTPKNASF
ncbi:asparagine--tRNA ligase [Blattabacterium cuenoti]|uniref:asparagine--tRNA ligase n=1 Tax=Blattabacterium cuenoti TaxID=1653831 RepID=UPI00163BCD3E|nr:asparagine--tRNA ligase [Blattabacterium cuenoti]